MDIEELKSINPWWKGEKISEDLAKPYQRKAFKEILELAKYRQILILSGLRRVGKSTLIFQYIEFLISRKASPLNILYFSFDISINELTEILKVYESITGIDWKNEKVFVFLDEIQKLKDWGSKIKLLYDNFPKLKFVVSGSSSVMMEKEAITTLAGRYFLIEVKPLSFLEFLELKKSKIDLKRIELWEEEIKKEFESYVKRPYPEIFDWSNEILIKKYIRESIIDKVLHVDLRQKFKDVNPELLNKLIEIFYSSPGIYLNYDTFSKDLKVSKKVLIRHIFYLEFSYLIRKVRNLRTGALISSRKLQKIYPFHWSLVLGITGFNNLYESIASSLIDAKFYWRKNGKEVDFIVKNRKTKAIEVKEGEKITNEELKSLVYFCLKNDLKRANVVYSGEEKTLSIKGINIELVPIWKFCLSYNNL